MKKKSNGQNFSRPQGSGDAIKDYRFFVVAAVFLLLCLLFVIFLVRACNIGPTKEYETYDVSEKTVLGERGCIYDRNGELLVGNSITYDFIFEYGSMPSTRKGVNNSLLKCIERLEASGNSDKRAEDYFPFEGSYPKLSLKDETKDTDTKIGTYYDKFLKKNDLAATLSAPEIAAYFVDKYRLDENGYTDKEKHELIRIYYEMERINFGAFEHLTIAKGLDPNSTKVMSLITAVKETRIDGANFLKRTERVYYYEGYAEHILGSVGRIYAEEADKYIELGYSMNDIVGKTGCELAFEQYLRGSDGKEVMKYDSDGKLVGKPYYSVEPKRGNDIYLTIDIKLQIKAEDSLRERIDSLDDSESGAVTVIDPQTGEVLAMASYSDVSGMNLALFGLYAPGSTYKVGSALAALEMGVINANTKYNCTQSCDFGPDCMGLHGYIDVDEAITHSCNIFFDSLGLEMGMDAITEYTKRLGLGVSSGIEIGDAAGVVADKYYVDVNEDYEWRDFDEAAGAIGQSVHQYTPLQLSVYMSSVVNGGTRYGAHLLKAVMRGDEVIYAQKPEVNDVIEISDSTHGILMDAMQSVIDQNDTLSRYFSSIGVSVGGKTGTAQTSNDVDNALFSGYATSDGRWIVASCVLEQGEVGTNAARVVAEIFDEYFNPTEPEADEAE